MILNLTQVTSGKLSKIPFQYQFKPELEAFAEFGITAVDNFDIEGYVERVGSELEIDYTVKGFLTYPCARCVEPVQEPIEYHIQKNIIRSIGNEDDDNSECYFMTDYNMDLDEVVLDEILMNMPYQVFCSDDCKGLCVSCGVNLNNETCSCSDEKIDPRMEILKNFFSQN